MYILALPPLPLVRLQENGLVSRPSPQRLEHVSFMLITLSPDILTLVLDSPRRLASHPVP